MTARSDDFDDYAEDYDAALQQGLAVTGEDKTYYAAGRVALLARLLAKINFKPESVLDFGCGTGSATPYLLTIPGVQRLIGVDISVRSLEVAEREHGSEAVSFEPLSTYRPSGAIDLAFVNGVFHHIPLTDRPGAVRCVFDSLRPGGIFAFWENNPWNPGTRWVMDRCPFDKDAITLSPPEARRMLREGGFQVLRSDYKFIFPRSLRWMRWSEKLVQRLPLGGQYQVLARKPS
jgi:SAM-dependent methyltransferase